MIGSPIAHYRIVSKLGEGGMGAVYRAHDTKLGRDVAIKVLPPALANDADYIARFQREAQVLASLNHPNIAAIYGLEENAFVMELVEGAEPKGPLPLDEAIHIAKQIADALEAAHERGIIHRDLKPANIRITPDGTVKVLDFGLAKAPEPAKAPPASADSPTLTIAATQAGIILGTAAYMSPEQARGRPVDRRADIWAFGVVLWELLTGRQMFQGETVTDTLAAVLTRDPDFSAVPPRVERLLKLCLARDPRQRLRDISGARLLLETEPEPAPHSRTRLPWLLAALASVIAVGFAVAMVRTPTASSSAPVIRFSLPHRSLALLSPDGRWILRSGGEGLHLRAVNDIAWRLLPATEGVSDAFWSPDSSAIGFFANGRLSMVRLDGSVPRVLAQAADPGGGSWRGDSSEGLMIFATGGQLHTVDIKTGTLSPVALRLESGERAFAPVFCPEGDNFVYFAEALNQQGEFVGTLYSASLSNPGGQRERIASTRYRPEFRRHPRTRQWMLFFNEREDVAVVYGSVMAAPADPRTGRLTGPALRVVHGVSGIPGNRRANFDVADSGLILWRHASAAQPIWRLSWLDRSGNLIGSVGERGYIMSQALSPDEEWIVAYEGSPFPRNWLYKTRSGVRQPLVTATSTGRESPAIWSHDSRALYFAAAELIVRQSVLPGEAPDPVTPPLGRMLIPQDVTSDGRELIATSWTGNEVFRIDLKAPLQKRTPERIASGQRARLSPDGKSLLLNDRNRLFSASYPSSRGADSIRELPGVRSSYPIFSRDGRELFAPNTFGMYSYPLLPAPDGAFRLGQQSLLFRFSYPLLSSANIISATRDRQRFLVITNNDDVEADTQVLSDWTTLIGQEDSK